MNLESRPILFEDIGRQVLTYGARTPAAEERYFMPAGEDARRARARRRTASLSRTMLRPPARSRSLARALNPNSGKTPEYLRYTEAAARIGGWCAACSAAHQPPSTPQISPAWPSRIMSTSASSPSRPLTP